MSTTINSQEAFAVAGTERLKFYREELDRLEATPGHSAEVAEWLRENIRSLQPEPDESFQPIYSPWRHGGWYVDNVRYPSGAVGCVTRKMLNPKTGKADRKWRIACDDRPEDYTYPNRDAAARAEKALADSMT